MIVVFTGIDGAGKTTQAKLLRDALLEEGIDARYEHLTGPNFRLTRWIKDQVGEAFLDREEARQLCEDSDPDQTNPGSNHFNPVGHFFLWRGWYQSWVRTLSNRTADVLVLDRFLYDDLVRTRWKYGYSPEWMSKLLTLAPSPDLVIYLDATPEIAWERESDGRTTVAQHQKKRECVEELAGRFLQHVNVDRFDTSEVPIDETHDRVLKSVMAHRND